MTIESRKAWAESSPREERRAVFTVRASESGAVGIEGYASTTGDAYEVNDALGSYSEVIEPGAFRKALSERDDVRLLVNHDGIPIARTKSGTMSLREDIPGGLHVDAPDLDGSSPLVQTVKSALARGDIDQMSFAFSVPAGRQTWSPDYSQRTIHEVKLYDVSVVTYPANPATSVKMRDAFHDLAEALRAGAVLTAEQREMLAVAVTPAIDPVSNRAAALRQTQLKAFLLTH